MKFTSRHWLLAFFLCVFAFGERVFVGRSWSQVQVPSASPKAQSARKIFERSAAQLEFFDLHPFLYNRTNLDFTPADASAGTRYFQLLSWVLDPQIPAAEIAPLRRHTDAKVRTLALAALFQRNDPHLLPLIVE